MKQGEEFKGKVISKVETDLREVKITFEDETLMLIEFSCFDDGESDLDISLEEKKEDEKYISIPTLQFGTGKSATILYGPSGKGKSIIGEALDKYQKEGWDSLNESEQKLLKEFEIKDS